MDEPAWTSLDVESSHRRTASTCARDRFVRFSWLTEPIAVAIRAMLNEVLLARHHFEVLRNIVGLVAIFVMNLFAINKPAAEAIFGDHPVLVCISTNIGQVVPGSDTD